MGAMMSSLGSAGASGATSGAASAGASAAASSAGSNMLNAIGQGLMTSDSGNVSSSPEMQKRLATAINNNQSKQNSGALLLQALQNIRR